MRRVSALILALSVLGVWLLTAPPRDLPAAPEKAPAPPAPRVTAAPDVPLGYLGSARCASCHAAEAQAWRGSQHARAMQESSASTVLGDFREGEFGYGGIASRFFRRDGRFLARTDGADGQPVEVELGHTFGVAPLQQYLVSLPDGRKQALGIAWDARAAASGGQRWLHLYPDAAIRAGDRLHWSGIDQNWNHQCADCHVTAFQKRYEPVADRFDSRWSELGVGCEACHGPGSQHVARAERGLLAADGGSGLTAQLDERRGVSWTIASGAVTAHRSRARDSFREIEVCARCHSRRGRFAEDHDPGDPFTDAFRPALLEPGLYHPDGQMRDEVFNHGSFLQSRMASQGVTCADCHQPHTQALRAPANAVCSQCHLPGRFDTVEHHHHADGTAGARCTACHMPTSTYMVVDPRHDHSMRIPRPDRSAALGTPDACMQCHADKGSAWAAQAVRAWYPERKAGFQDFAEAFAGAERGETGALAELTRIGADPARPPIVRASAIARLASHPRSWNEAAFARALRDPEPIVRFAAVEGLAGSEPMRRSALLAPLAADPSRLVRIEVARALAGRDAGNASLGRARGEFLDEIRLNADRPEAQLALGNARAAENDVLAATTAYRKALSIDPGFVEASVNLSELLRHTGDETGAEELLRASIARDPSAAAAHHALGLALVRQGRREDALAALARAAELAPATARFAWVHAVALHDAGRIDEAFEILQSALENHPNDRDLLVAAASWAREVGREEILAEYLRRLRAFDPGDRALQDFVHSLQAAGG
jgi:tetratricopeptide (TPR) repeat protein